MRCWIVQENWSRENADIKSVEFQKMSCLGFFILGGAGQDQNVYILISIFLDLYVQVIFIVPLTTKIICKPLYKVYYEECLGDYCILLC